MISGWYNLIDVFSFPISVVDQSMKSDVAIPDFKSSYQKMEKIASNLNAELANFHVGRANTEMLVLFSVWI